MVILFIAIILLFFILSKSKNLNNINGFNMNFNFDTYKNLLGFMESNNNWEVENSIGALGRYQFMPATLNSLMNIYNLPEWQPKENFLNNHSLQDEYLKALVDDNLLGIKRNQLDRHLNRIVTGRIRFPEIASPINYYGLQAGAHLGGIGNLKKYLENDIDFDDGNTSISDYVTYFSNKTY